MQRQRFEILIKPNFSEEQTMLEEYMTTFYFIFNKMLSYI